MAMGLGQGANMAPFQHWGEQLCEQVRSFTELGMVGILAKEGEVIGITGCGTNGLREEPGDGGSDRQR